jgi:hypothetical protein
MSLSIRYAVLSYCPDLTDPDAELQPLALIGVGGDDAFGFFVVRSEPGRELGKDEVSRSVLNNLPALLQRQMREGLEDVGPRQFLSWLHDRYRNSLSISAISSEVVPLDSSVEEALLRGTIFPPLLDLYRRIVRGAPALPRSRPPVEVDDTVAPAYGVAPFVRRRASADAHAP